MPCIALLKFTANNLIGQLEDSNEENATFVLFTAQLVRSKLVHSPKACIEACFFIIKV